MPGPKKQPKEIADKKGTFRKDRYPDNMPDWVTCDELPNPPEHLQKIEAVLWYKTCQELKNNGMLIESYLNMLERYCDAHFQYRINRDILHELGEDDGDFRNKHDQIIPEYTAMDKSRKYMDSVEREFGFTPSARGKIEIPEIDEGDDLEKILNR